MTDLAVLDVNETLFPLDPIAARMTQVGLDGRLELWFARVLRDGISAAAAGRFVTFRALATHHLDVLLAAEAGSAEPLDLDGADPVEHVLAGFEEVQLHPDVGSGLQRLRDGGVTVVALTNGAASVASGALERAGVRELVTAVHDVGEAGRWKPAPAAYLWALDRHGVAAGRAAMIAAHPWDLQGAQAVGMVGAWLDRDDARYPPGFPPPDVQGRDLHEVAEALTEPS